MTAINVIRQKNAVHVITDGAGIDADGRLVCLVQKVSILSHLNAVLALRGARGLALIMLGLTERVNSYDALKEFIVSGLQVECRPALPIWDRTLPPFGSKFDLFVAGWSESMGPDSYFISSYDNPGVPAWTAMQLNPVAITPGEESMLALVPSPDAFDPIHDGVKILQAQRSLKIPQAKERAWSIVGGFAQATTVEQSGISTRVIHRWPDKIRKKISG